jgi:ribonuclease HII
MLTKKWEKTKFTKNPARPRAHLRSGFLIGIDEAGRGALAGPVSVGCVMWRVEDWARIKEKLKDYPAGKDSKKLTAKQRDFWFTKIEELSVRHLVAHTVALVSNKVIDKRGINWAIKEGIKKCLDSLDFCEVGLRAHLKFNFAKAQSLVLLDGGLKAPVEWRNQQTIIKGDEKELIISLASIVAKVLRDQKMVKLGKKYPQHNFHQHKGYGTQLHYEKITEFGVLIIHRKTYLNSLHKNF